MTDAVTSPARRSGAITTLAWVWVALPFGYGVWQLFAKITQLFGS